MLECLHTHMKVRERETRPGLVIAPLSQSSSPSDPGHSHACPVCFRLKSNLASGIS